MSCTSAQSQLNKHLGALEKNKGICDTLYQSALFQNPLYKFLGDAIANNMSNIDPTVNAKDVVTKINGQVGNPISTLTNLFNGFISSSEFGLMLYYYYLMKNKLYPLLQTRIELTRELREHFVKVYDLTKTSFFYRLSPSAQKEYQTLIQYLERARSYLSKIHYYTTVKRDESGKIMPQGYEFPNILSDPKAVVLTDVTKLKSIIGNEVFYFITQAFKELENAQNFLRLIITNKEFTGYEKEVLQRIQEFLSLNNSLIIRVAKLTPLLSSELLKLIDFKRLLKNGEQFIADSVLNLQPTETLLSLSSQITILKSVVGNFETISKDFKKRTNDDIERQLVTYHNVELDKLVADIKGKEYPLSLFDFFLKAPAWYSRIEVIKYSLFILNVSNTTMQYSPESSMYVNTKKEISSAGMTADYGMGLYKSIISYFPELVKVLYIGNFIKSTTKTRSIKQLIKQCDSLIAQDLTWRKIIYNAPEPPGYVIFEAALSKGINALQTSFICGRATELISKSLQTGIFLVLPSVSGQAAMQSVKSLINSSKNLGPALQSITNVPDLASSLADSLGSVFSGIEDFFDFESCDKLKNNNLFLDPSLDAPDGNEIVTGIADAYSELWEAVSSNL